MVDFLGPKVISQVQLILKQTEPDSDQPDYENMTSSEDEDLEVVLSDSSQDEPAAPVNTKEEIGQSVKSINEKILSSSLAKTKGVKNPIKVLVSKQKRRFKLDGFNLDLTYVTEKLIAMGYPALNIESFYRNSMSDVVKFFNQRHPEHYRIYNLCSERKYSHAYFNNHVAEFPFEDHNPPDLALIYAFCSDVESWLKADEKNVAGIHCKAGKGRTGTMICCFLLYSRQFSKADDALLYYGMIRTKNKKGVTIPSQVRYVRYFEKCMNLNLNLSSITNPLIRIRTIKFSSLPNITLLGGRCDLWFEVQSKDGLVSWKDSSKQQGSNKNENLLEMRVQEDILVRGDFRMQFYASSIIKKKEKLFHLWLNSFFLESSPLVISKSELDKCCKDKSGKKFSNSFQIEIHFTVVDFGKPEK